MSTVPVCMGIWAAVIRVPSPSHLALKEQFDGTVDGTVTHIRLSRYGRMGMKCNAAFCSAPSSYVPLAHFLSVS